MSPATPSPQALVAALVSACLFLQQLVVPLHLAGFDHVSLAGLSDHAHSHVEHRHGPHGLSHGPVSSWTDAPDDEHHPHPWEDHLDELADPPVSPPSVHVVVAPEPGPAMEALRRVLPVPERLRDHARSGPRPPPPRGGAPPRAPPIVA